MSEQLSPEANAQAAFFLGLLHERQAAAQEAIASHDDNEDGLAPNLHANNASSLTLEEGRALKRAKVLTTESDLEAEEFLKSPSIHKHLFMIAMVLFENRDMLKILSIDAVKKYTNTQYHRCSGYVFQFLCLARVHPPQKNIQAWAHAAILAPNIKYYRDNSTAAKGSKASSIAATMFRAMQSISVAELPPAHEVGRNLHIQTLLGKDVTTWCCHMKGEVLDYCLTPAEKEEGKIPEGKDIATLVHACIGTSPVVMGKFGSDFRIAFIRYCADIIGQKEAKDDDRFWQKVDEQLVFYVSIAKDEAELQILFSEIYKKDIKIVYGEPDKTLPFDRSKDVVPWIDVPAIHRLLSIGMTWTIFKLKTTSQARCVVFLSFFAVIEHLYRIAPCLRAVFVGLSHREYCVIGGSRLFYLCGISLYLSTKVHSTGVLANVVVQGGELTEQQQCALKCAGTAPSCLCASASYIAAVSKCVVGCNTTAEDTQLLPDGCSGTPSHHNPFLLIDCSSLYLSDGGDEGDPSSQEFLSLLRSILAHSTSTLLTILVIMRHTIDGPGKR
ncbi:hypothetical protein C8J57DRAFT_1538310 [Mycena rebaudengoi]|nr:hypothetical protein C8J57DRAFT_1538310 [Mycena rebaudengoi]